MVKTIVLASAAALAITSFSSPRTRTPQIFPLYTVGKVTWHAKNFVSKHIRVKGYLIKKETGYLIFSDESSGKLTSHDLPVIGKGIEIVKPAKKYILEGTFVYQGLNASNHNPYHLKLSRSPQIIR